MTEMEPRVAAALADAATALKEAERTRADALTRRASAVRAASRQGYSNAAIARQVEISEGRVSQILAADPS